MKVFTKLMVGAFVVTTLGVVGGNQTVSAGIEENIPGSNVANYFNNKVVKIQSEMNRGMVLDWDQSNLDQVIIYNSANSWNQKWNMFYNFATETYTLSTNPHQFNGFIKSASLSVSEKSFDSKGNPRIATTGLNSNWRLYKVGVDELLGDGLFVLQNTETGKVLGIENGAPSQGQKLVATEGEGRGTSSQRFRIHIVGNV